MTVTNVEQDDQALTLAITTELSVPIDRAWELWSDSRQLERWWGPPSHPATFVQHDLTPGATVTYFMTGPEGDRFHGQWQVLATDPPHHLEVEDRFADEAGNVDLDLPMTKMSVRLTEEAGGVTRMTIVSAFSSKEAMEQVLAMGVAEGMTLALGQIDEILAADASAT